MNSEYELALLRAFADSKSYEFKGFTLRYQAANPEPEEETVVDSVEESAVTLELEVTEASAEPIVEKPKSTRKKAAAEDAGA